MPVGCRLAGAIACLLLVATGPRAADSPNKPDAPAETPVTVEKAKSARIDNRKGMAWLEEAVIVHEGSRIAADHIELNKDKALGTASGHLRFESENATVTSDSARADFRGRRVVFEGNVRFVTQRESEGSEPEDIVLVCAKLEYFYRQDKGVATGPLRVEQSDQRASGDAAVYDGAADTFTIIGSVVVNNDRGETLEGAKATLHLKDDVIDLEGPGTGRFLIEEDTETPPAD